MACVVPITYLELGSDGRRGRKGNERRRQHGVISLHFDFIILNLYCTSPMTPHSATWLGGGFVSYLLVLYLRFSMRGLDWGSFRHLVWGVSLRAGYVMDLDVLRGTGWCGVLREGVGGTGWSRGGFRDESWLRDRGFWFLFMSFWGF